MKRKSGIVVLTLMLVTALLYGCGSEGADTDTAKQEPAASQETTAAVKETAKETSKEETTAAKEETTAAAETTQETSAAAQASTAAAKKKTQTQPKAKKKTQTKKPTKKAVQKQTTASKKAIAQKYVGKDVASLIAAVGSPSSRSYANSCLGSGEDGELRYSGFTVYTYRENGKETVQHVE